jgi:hypothetical protein
MNENLSALVFELKRAGSKADKAKVLARAWRSVRDLSPIERRFLAREVGFDGAEDLIEGLAGKGEGGFAPAAVLEALGKMRRDEGLSLRRIISDLRDPDRRDDLLVRGIDLVADSVVRPEEVMDGEGETPLHDRAPEIDDLHPRLVPESDSDESEEVTVPPVPRPEPEPKSEPVPRLEPEPVPEPRLEPEPETLNEPELQIEEPSPWDSMWQPVEPAVPTTVSSPLDFDEIQSVTAAALARVRPDQREGTTLSRLRNFRTDIEMLRGAGVHRLREALDDLPEPWARRRGLVALIEADIPDDAGSALDLIGELDRPMDRRWCLTALSRRGDLAGADLERALELLSSPAARRRVEALARR